MKTGKITQIQPAVPPTYFNNGVQKLFNVWDVTFAHGEQWQFMSIGDFKKSIGEEIQFEVKDEARRTAKLSKPKIEPMVYNPKSVKNDSTQTYIIRQNSASNSCNFFSGLIGQRDTEELKQEVFKMARELENYVLNG